MHSGGAKNNSQSTYDGVEEQDWLPAAALRYTRHGFPVGPLRGKVPLTPQGMKNFTTDSEQVQRWWAQYPGANIGVRPPVGWVVLDIDPRNGGADTWEQINHGLTLPATIVTCTGSGGWHWWFRLPYAGDIRGSAGEGIDVKTHRGYLVMPPASTLTPTACIGCTNGCSPAWFPSFPCGSVSTSTGPYPPL